MTTSPEPRYIAFSDESCIASGELAWVAAATKSHSDAFPAASNVLVFDARTSEPVELDLRGSLEDVTARYRPSPADLADGPDGDSPPSAPRTPGRPKLGVVSREVTLLPRHWEWLSTQPGSASVTLRRLVEQARRDQSASDSTRRAQDSAYRFMLAIAGNLEGFEEATRALYSGDAETFAQLTESWPRDVRDHARALAAGGFSGDEG